MRPFPQVCFLMVVMALLPCQVLAAPPSATRALSRELDQVKLDAIPLAEVVTLLADATGANFHINWRALQGAGVDRTTAVTLHLRHVTVRKTLSLMIEQLPATVPLSFFNDQGVIEVTTLELADLAVITKVYNVEDLLMVAPTIDPAAGAAGSTGTSFGGSNAQNTQQGSSTSGSGSGGTASSGAGTNSGANTATVTREQRLLDLVQLIRQTVEPAIWKVNGGTASISSFNGNLVITAPRRIHERIGGAIE